MDILTLLKANLRHKKGNFISIILLMLIISTMLTSVISVRTNLKARASEANEAVHTGDLVLFIDESKVTDELVSDIKNFHGVKDIDIKDSYILKSVTLNNKKFDTFLYITAYNHQKYPYGVFNDDATSFVSLKDGLKENEVLIPLSLKKNMSCKKGDVLKITLPSFKKDLKIAGFIEEPYMGADVMGAKNFLLNQKTYDEIQKAASLSQSDESLNNYYQKINMFHIYANDEYKNDCAKLGKDLNKECNIISLAIASLTLEQAKGYSLLVSNILCGVLIAFSFILLIIVILVLSNSIRTSIDMEYVNIGILKSQGFSKIKIRLVFLIQYLFAAFLGSVLGFFIAVPIIKYLRTIFIYTTGLLFSGSLCLFKSVLIISGILIILGLIILLKTSRVSKISPIMAISGGLENVYFKSIIQTPLISKHKSFINTRLGLRQLTSNIKQYGGTCLIITLLVLFLCLSASFKQTFTEKYFNEIFGIKTSDVVVTYNNSYSMKKDVEKTISEISDIDKSFYQGNLYFMLDDYQFNCQILDDSSYLTSILKGRAPKYDNEIVITNLISKQIEKGIGDKVTICTGEVKKQFIISGIYDSCCDVGQSFSMTFDGAKRLNSDYKQSSRNYILKDSSKATEIIDKINNSYSQYNIKAGTYSALNENAMKTVIDCSNIMIYFIYFISIVFAIIVVSMVCSKAFLKEQHDLGVYKAFGFSSTSLRVQFCIRFLFVSVIGGLIGTVIYIFLGNDINVAVLTLAGVSNFHADLTFFNVGLPGLIICLFVLISSFIVMKKIKKVDTKCLIVE